MFNWLVSNTGFRISGSFMTTLEDGSLIPSIWTPVIVIQKAAAMDALYPDKLLEDFNYTEDKLPPPQVRSFWRRGFNKTLINRSVKISTLKRAEFIFGGEFFLKDHFY
jgi:hypothetical protein